MRMFLIRFGFASALITTGPGAPIAQDVSANLKASHRVAGVSYAEKTRATRVVDVDYQLTEQERIVIAFLRLKADAERNARQAPVFSQQASSGPDGSDSANFPH